MQESIILNESKIRELFSDALDNFELAVSLFKKCDKKWLISNENISFKAAQVFFEHRTNSKFLYLVMNDNELKEILFLVCKSYAEAAIKILNSRYTTIDEKMREDEHFLTKAQIEEIISIHSNTNPQFEQRIYFCKDENYLKQKHARLVRCALEESLSFQSSPLEQLYPQPLEYPHFRSEIFLRDLMHRARELFVTFSEISQTAKEYYKDNNIPYTGFGRFIAMKDPIICDSYYANRIPRTNFIASAGPTESTLPAFLNNLINYPQPIKEIVNFCSNVQVAGERYRHGIKGEWTDYCLTERNFTCSNHTVKVNVQNGAIKESDQGIRPVDIVQSEVEIDNKMFNVTSFYLEDNESLILKPDDNQNTKNKVDRRKAILWKLFIKSLEQPIWVHCSDGVGRTGNLILMFQFVKLFHFIYQDFKPQDCAERMQQVLSGLRLVRPGLIFSEEQYEDAIRNAHSLYIYALDNKFILASQLSSDLLNAKELNKANIEQYEAAAYQVPVLHDVSKEKEKEKEKETRSHVPDYMMTELGGPQISFCFPAIKHPSVETAWLAKPTIKLDAKSALYQPQHVIIALDVSGSMTTQSGGSTRIELAKRALISLINSLNPDDSFAIVIFNSVGKVLVPMMHKREVKNVSTIVNRIPEIKPTDGTSIQNAFRQVFDERLITRPGLTSIILITDGDDDKFKVEEMTAEMQKRYGRIIFTIPMGVGQKWKKEKMEEIGTAVDFPTPIHIADGASVEPNFELARSFIGQKATKLTLELIINGQKQEKKSLGIIKYNQERGIPLEFSLPDTDLAVEDLRIDYLITFELDGDDRKIVGKIMGSNALGVTYEELIAQYASRELIELMKLINVKEASSTNRRTLKEYQELFHSQPAKVQRGISRIANLLPPESPTECLALQATRRALASATAAVKGDVNALRTAQYIAGMTYHSPATAGCTTGGTIQQLTEIQADAILYDHIKHQIQLSQSSDDVCPAIDRNFDFANPRNRYGLALDRALEGREVILIEQRHFIKVYADTGAWYPPGRFSPLHHGTGMTDYRNKDRQEIIALLKKELDFLIKMAGRFSPKSINKDIYESEHLDEKSVKALFFGEEMIRPLVYFAAIAHSKCDYHKNLLITQHLSYVINFWSEYEFPKGSVHLYTDYSHDTKNRCYFVLFKVPELGKVFLIDPTLEQPLYDLTDNSIDGDLSKIITIYAASGLGGILHEPLEEYNITLPLGCVLPPVSPRAYESSSKYIPAPIHSDLIDSDQQPATKSLSQTLITAKAPAVPAKPKREVDPKVTYAPLYVQVKPIPATSKDWTHVTNRQEPQSLTLTKLPTSTHDDLTNRKFDKTQIQTNRTRGAETPASVTQTISRPVEAVPQSGGSLISGLVRGFSGISIAPTSGEKEVGPKNEEDGPKKEECLVM